MSLTLRVLKNTGILKLYSKLVLGERLSYIELSSILQIALICIQEENENLKNFGYRIIVLYSNLTNDFLPLYDISVSKNYTPIAKLIERMEKYEPQFSAQFFKVFNSSFQETFRKNSIYLTEQQLDLYTQLGEMRNDSAVVVAPTSYGKSELVLSSLNFEIQNICILVPTKALIAQTKRRVLNSESYTKKRKIVTHPEMYASAKDKSIVAILTQERLLGLLQENKDLFFDLVFVDEAHNLLDGDERNTLLASAIILLKKRNVKTSFNFLTPFIFDSESLDLHHADIELSEHKINEYIKTEKYFYCDVNDENCLYLYDQFFNEFLQIANENYKNEMKLISNKKGSKNIVYLNRPFKIEKLARKFVSESNILTSEKITGACRSISDYVHKDYQLIDCLRRGIVYHHGSVPDSIKLYVEYLYANVPEIDLIITNSTLLEGVNIPAEKIFVLEAKKGISNLSASQFKNLVGRVCRFSEIFNPEKGNLKLLEPEVYLIKSDFTRADANLKKFLKDTVRVEKEFEDELENALLKNTPSSQDVRDARVKAEEFLENFEPGILTGKNVRKATTDFGRSCFANSVSEIDVLEFEELCQQMVDVYAEDGRIAEDVDEVLLMIDELFLPFVDDYNLSRLQQEPARRFYSMFLSWRVEGLAIGEMIGRFLYYWKQNEEKDPLVFVGSKWGEVSREEGGNEHWIDIRSKSNKERVNLAIVRIKEEQDFIDTFIMKFVEVLNSLTLISSDAYYEIKYGTSSVDKIVLMNNGVSSHLSTVLLNKYKNFVKIDELQNLIEVKKDLRSSMITNKENDILIFELEYTFGNKIWS